MIQTAAMELKILGLLPHDDIILVSGELVSGDLSGFMTCVETGGKWGLVGNAFISFNEIEARNDRLRLIALEHVEGNKDLEKGFTLTSE